MHLDPVLVIAREVNLMAGRWARSWNRLVRQPDAVNLPTRMVVQSSRPTRMVVKANRPTRMLIR